MRRLSREQKARQIRLACYCAKRKANIRRAICRRKSRRLRGREVHPQRRFIAVPHHLRYHGRSGVRERFDEFASRVSRALSLGFHVKLDFSQTDMLFPCGMLLFLGHLDKWLESYPGRLTCNYPENDVVEQMLQSAKVLQRLGRPPRKEITHDWVVKWHQFEGQWVDGTPIEPFLDEVRAETSVGWQLALGDCIMEALTNVKKHAYRDGQPTHWWMFATIDREKRRIFVAMHDRGASIPGTLLAKPEWLDKVTLRHLRLRGDCELIAAAAGGRSRTRLYYRGKGLPEMLEFSSRHPGNALAIYSRRGYLVSEAAASPDAKALQVTGPLKQPVEGTLVIWTANFGEAG